MDKTVAVPAWVVFIVIFLAWIFIWWIIWNTIDEIRKDKQAKKER